MMITTYLYARTIPEKKNTYVCAHVILFKLKQVQLIIRLFQINNFWKTNFKSMMYL